MDVAMIVTWTDLFLLGLVVVSYRFGFKRGRQAEKDSWYLSPEGIDNAVRAAIAKINSKPE